VKGAADLFRHLRQNKVRIAFNTDLHRNVTDLILDKINWYGSRKQIHVPIDEIVCSDEVSSGRPLPYMIFKTMEKLMIDDTKKVIKIGDTPSDLAKEETPAVFIHLESLEGSIRFRNLSCMRTTES
jgi:phosphoglycolate phosphatase-like HAD superfamily hydrolase